MKTLMTKLLCVTSLTIGIGQIALAQSVLTCFYECKPLPTGGGFQEVTTLMVTNSASPLLTQPSRRFANVVFVNGNEKVLARSLLDLSGRDVDELNVCATLEVGIGFAPSAGIIQLGTSLDPAGNVPDATEAVDAWMKNLLGRFRPADPANPITFEPFQSGRVTGVAKTQCTRQLDTLVNSEILANDPEVLNAVQIRPILIEKTEDLIIVPPQ